MNSNGEIILYQSDNSIQLDVRLEDETVWLSLNQMSDLFERDKSVISKHIKNIFNEQELDKNAVVAKNATTALDGKIYQVEYFSLDVIISVGYRVKSKRGTQFRIWANTILKEYLLKGYVVNQRIENLEHRVSTAEDKIDFFIKTNLPPVEGIFFEGQIFDAYKFVSDLVKSAKIAIQLIDNYVDESVLLMFSKRSENVKCTIYTNKMNSQLKLDLAKYNAQYEPIEIKEFPKSHDRFLIIDDKTLYHIGASLKDLGKKWFAFSKMNLDITEILSRMS